jgi:hypothetical protein
MGNKIIKQAILSHSSSPIFATRFAPFDNLSLFIRKLIELIYETIDLSVGGVDPAREEGFFVVRFNGGKFLCLTSKSLRCLHDLLRSMNHRKHVNLIWFDIIDDTVRTLNDFTDLSCFIFLNNPTG